MIEAQKAGIKVLLCRTIPDPRLAVDAKLQLLDQALNDLDIGPGNDVLNFRGLLLKPYGRVNKECYIRRDIHLSEGGEKVIGCRIRLLLDMICPPEPDKESDIAPTPNPPPVVQAEPSAMGCGQPAGPTEDENFMICS